MQAQKLCTKYLLSSALSGLVSFVNLYNKNVRLEQELMMSIVIFDFTCSKIHQFNPLRLVKMSIYSLLKQGKEFMPRIFVYIYIFFLADMTRNFENIPHILETL